MEYEAKFNMGVSVHVHLIVTHSGLSKTSIYNLFLNLTPHLCPM